MNRAENVLRQLIPVFSSPSAPWTVRVLEVFLLVEMLVLPVNPGTALMLICFIGLPVLVVHMILHAGRGFSRNPYFWPVTLFLTLAIVVSAFGVRPQSSLRSLYRLLPAGMIFLIGTVFPTLDERREKLLLLSAILFLTGCACRAVVDGMQVLIFVAAGNPVQYFGKMTRAPFYMVALCLLLAAWLHRPKGMARIALVAGIAFNAVGLLIHLKRGTWISFGLAVVMMSLVKRRFMLPVAVILIGSGLWLVPPIRARVLETATEFSVSKGGRLAAWTQVAPKMIREHPLGMGYGAPRSEDFVKYWPRLQRFQHLHNNILQVAVELGWLGLCVWVAWMLVTWRMMRDAYRRTTSESPDLVWVALGCWCAFAGLFTNGMMDHNFFTTSLLIVYFHLMGFSNVLARGRSG